MNIKEYLKQRKIITDGAFGTYYAEKYKTEEMPEKANLTHKQRVKSIHMEYIESGAKLIRTNTFAANSILLGCDKEELKENIKSAVKIAKEAVEESKKEIFIAGDIGPIPKEVATTDEEVQQQYYSIAKTFAEEGINILNFETFSDMNNLLPAVEKIKSEYDIFVNIMFSVNQFGYSTSGQSGRKLICQAAEIEYIDSTGLNCGVGPSHMEKLLENINLQNGKFIMVVPNSGYPNIIRNKVTFSDNPEYFAHKVRDITNLPVNIVGGCCGTNPEFIRQLSAIANLDPVAITKKNLSRTTQLNSKVCKGFFCNSDGSPKSKKLIAVELAPPANTNDEKLLAAAKSLKESNVDVLTFPDSPSGRTRIDSVLMAQKVKQATGMTVMPHICCRDKNAIAMRSLFLGAYINDINNMLIITGDPIPTMARQTVKSVFNFDSVGLMKIAQEMNEDTFVNSPLSYGGAINQGRNRLDLEINRVKKKMAAGAEFFLTQPVFSKDSADRVRKIKEETNARILVGIMPLISKKNAIFMKNEIAGVQVTDEVVSLYSENATKEQGEAVGISLAKNIISFTEDFADGYYFSFPFNRVHMLKKILDKD